MLARSLAGLPAFLGYLLVVTGLCALFLVVYVRLTPHREFHLMTREGNAAASLALGMSLLGFTFPLASAVLHSVGIVDCLIWGAIALVVQIMAYFLARLPFPTLSEQIAENSTAGALWLGFVSVAAGVLSAACMTP